MPRVESISSNIIQSEIRTMSIECAKVGGINLSQGFSDTDIHPIIAEGAKQAIDGGINHYTRFDGLPELRQAVADKLRRYNHVDYDAESEVLITSGSTAGLFCVLYGLFQPGDEIVVFEPYYGYHVNTLFAANMKPAYVRLEAPSWDVDAA